MRTYDDWYLRRENSKEKRKDKNNYIVSRYASKNLGGEHWCLAAGQD